MVNRLVLVFLITCFLGVSAHGMSRFSRLPDGKSNICSLLKLHRGWIRPLKKAEKKWGIPAHVQLATIWKESSFTRNAKTSRTKLFGIIPWHRRSTAQGYAQALDGTWKEYKKANGKKFASRNNFAHSVDFIGWYMNKASKSLSISKKDAYRQYLAYHEGVSGYKRGSYKSKGWLVNTAKAVQARATLYEGQLKKCRYF